LDDHLGALEVESKAHLAQVNLGHSPPQTHFVFGVEHEEATATGTY
jgi:hypothetical protein